MLVLFGLVCSGALALDVGLARATCAEREPLPSRLESIPGWDQTHSIHLHSTYRVNFTVSEVALSFTVAERSLFRLYIAPDDALDIDVRIENVNAQSIIVRLTNVTAAA